MSIVLDILRHVQIAAIHNLTLDSVILFPGA